MSFILAVYADRRTVPSAFFDDVGMRRLPRDIDQGPVVDTRSHTHKRDSHLASVVIPFLQSAGGDH
ncbi:hypothetical protein, partial [Aminobacter ciceronei]